MRFTRLPLLCGLLVLGLSATASAEPVFTGRVSLTGMLYTETESPAPMPMTAGLAATSQLGYLDLRAVLEGKRLWQDRLDLRLDFRVRVTGSLDLERPYEPMAMQPMDPNAGLGISAQGYAGGREYDLREIYGLLRLTARDTLQVGRMLVREADTAKFDGVRYARKFGGHWEGSVFGGGYPDPYSRSLLTDYTPVCGDGIYGARDKSIPDGTMVNAAGTGFIAPCQTSSQLSLGAGLGATYNYSTLWGAVGLVGTFFGGPGDGGPVVPVSMPAIMSPAQQYLQPPSNAVDAPRVYLSWMNSWRPLDRLDVFSDLVFDMYGSAGPQLTRLLAMGTLRLLKDDRLSLRLGYTHLSSLGIDMFLNRLVYNRISGATLALSGYSMVENNLTVLRTGQDEVRFTADAKLVRRLGVYLDGRFRYRSLIGASGDPSVYLSPVYTSNTAPYAGDATIGARDSGSIKDIRAGLAYTALFSFRSMNHVITLDLGRDFLHERLGLDFQYAFVYTKDNGASQPPGSCPGATPSGPLSPFSPGCYGLRQGSTHEVGLTLAGNPWRKLFLLLDYRFIATLTNNEGATATSMGTKVPSIYANALLLRGEYRW